MQSFTITLIQIKNMEINFNGSLLTEIQTTDNSIKILRAVDGWGNKIDISKIIIDNKKQEDVITISKKEYEQLKKDSYTLWNCVDQ
jgi:hypothetical protein